MKHVRSIFSALICASLCLVGSYAQAQQAPQAKAQPAAPQARAAAPKSLLVGVIDLRSVIQNHPIVVEQIPALAMKMQQEEQNFNKVRMEADKKVESIQSELKLKPGTPEYEEQISLVRKEVADADIKFQEAQQKLVYERTQLLFQSYKDLQAAIETVAKQNGVIIVHSKIKIAAPEDSNVSEEIVALQEADSNTIVWNRPECDITEAVKAQLAANVGLPKKGADAASPLANLGGQAMSASNRANAPTRTASAPAAHRR